MRRLWPLLLLFALSACNGAPLSTQWKLRNFNLGTADLAQLRVAMRGPEWTQPTPELASIEARYWRGDDEAQAKSTVLRLRRAVHETDREALAQLGAAPSLTIVELAPQSVAMARAVQLEMASWKADGGPQPHGKLHLEGTLGCRRGEIPEGPIPLDFFVHANDETGWLPVYDQRDLRADYSGSIEALREALPPCPDRNRTR